jgi:FdhD protein
MVQKAAMAHMSALVAISAPTAAAVRLAEECGLTLVAFARGANFVCYAHPTDALFG